MALLTVSGASDTWGISRTTIYAKIKAGQLSQRPDKKIDTAEMLRVFGEPNAKKNVKRTKNKNGAEQELTFKVMLLEQQLEYEKKMREAEESRALRAEKQASDFFDELKKLTETVQAIEQRTTTPEPESGVLSRFFK